jgi:calcineurin-like phosphoesterase family protein
MAGMKSHPNITRRDFLRVSGAGIVTAAAAGSVVPLDAKAAEGEAGFSFVIANDLHYRDERCARWFEKVTASIRGFDPAFVVLAGDLSENGDRTQLGAVRDIFRTLSIPLKAVIGNHDHHAGEGRKAFADLFGAAPNARFDFGAWQFLLLDTTEGNNVFRTRISTDTLQWAERAARAIDREKPVLVVSHFPLGRNWLRPVNASALIETLRNCNFHGSFGGHWHGWTEPVDNGVQLVTGRCCSWWRTNHDGSDQKGYFLCRATPNGVTHRFVVVA